MKSSKLQKVQKDRERLLKTIKVVLEDEFPPGYNARRDDLADKLELANSVNRLGLALRDAVNLLEESK